MDDSNFVCEIHVNKYEWKTDLFLKKLTLGFLKVIMNSK